MPGSSPATSTGRFARADELQMMDSSREHRRAGFRTAAELKEHRSRVSGTRLASGLVGETHHGVLRIPHMRKRDERRVRQRSVFLQLRRKPGYNSSHYHPNNVFPGTNCQNAKG